MAGSTVLIFGPTGNVASVAARSVQEYGAKVFLAMRDLHKPIPGLNSQQEREYGFERIQADLTKPDTVAAVVEKTGAKHAFFYLAPGTSDHMKSTIAALKSAGIEFVVFLSSFSVQGDIKEILPSELIPYSHAQVEINLQEAFGAKGFVAVRPAWFASNALWWKTAIKDGEVKIVSPDAMFDWISPSDIGRACGRILAGGSRGIDIIDGQSSITLCGPEMLSQRDAVAIIGRAVGKNVKVSPADEQEGFEIFVKDHGLPEPVAKYLVKNLREADQEDYAMYQGRSDEGIGNLRKYSGREPMRFQQWVDQNKSIYSA